MLLEAFILPSCVCTITLLYNRQDFDYCILRPELLAPISHMQFHSHIENLPHLILFTFKCTDLMLAKKLSEPGARLCLIVLSMAELLALLKTLPLS